MVSRVGSVSLLNSTLRDVTDVQTKLGVLQQQISSGFKASTFVELNGQVEQFTLMEAKMRNSQQFIDSNQIGVARLKTADQAMGNLIDITDSIENLMVQARNTASGDIHFEQQARNMLAQIASELNITFEGRYLFGGLNTTEAPFPDATAGPVNEGVPDANYYAGSSENLVYRADERIEYEFPMRADDPSIQKIVAAIHQAIRAVGDGDDSALAAATDLIQAGQEELNAARSQVNISTINLEQVNDRLGALKLYWQGVTEQITKTDMVAASTEVANHEAILQATFQVYARLSQLRLSDYLR